MSRVVYAAGTPLARATHLLVWATLGFVSLNVGQRVPLRILYGVSSFESGKDYLLVSYHLVPTLAMRGIYYSLRLQPLRRTPL